MQYFAEMMKNIINTIGSRLPQFFWAICVLVIGWILALVVSRVLEAMLKRTKLDEKLALRPTSETLYTPMFKLWIRSHRDLPLKLYQRGSVFRLDTKATRPLIRTREILWIEAHDAFASKKESDAPEDSVGGRRQGVTLEQYRTDSQH